MPFALQVTTSTSRRGAESFAYDLQRVLVARGRSARLVALAPGSGTQLPLDALAADRWRALRPLRRLARDAAVVAGHGSDTLLACAAATAHLKTPFVYRNIGTPLYWAGSRARRLRVSMALRTAERVAALWSGARGELIEFFGVDPSRIRVIPNGRPASIFPVITPDERVSAQRAAGIDAALVLVFLGALSHEKGLDVAIRAVAEIPDALLVVAGAGSLEEELRALAEKEAPRQVRWLGSTADPQSVLALADVVVLPSRTEGLPGVAIEAGLSGLPVVASAVGGTSEIVLDGRSGILVPPEDPEALRDAILVAASNAHAFGVAGRAHCLPHFDLEVVADQWERLLDEVAIGAW